jgi:hypothetical protein
MNEIHLIYWATDVLRVRTRCDKSMFVSQMHGSTEPEHVTCLECRTWIERNDKANSKYTEVNK